MSWRPAWTFTATDGVAAWTWAMARSTSGTFATGHSGFGRSRVSGSILVPCPAASTMAAKPSVAARLSGMETRRWTNPGQPQTLQIAVFLLYFNAVMNVLFGSVFASYLIPLDGLLITAGSVAGGFGIANEKKWGYKAAVAVAGYGLVPFVALLLDNGITSILDLQVMIALVFPVALFALLVHPQSRDYQRIWFS
jgi:hypothetical protein